MGLLQTLQLLLLIIIRPHPSDMLNIRTNVYISIPQDLHFHLDFNTFAGPFVRSLF